MPAGVSWPTYLKFSIAAALSMIAGAQTVHHIYKPLEDLDQFIVKFEEDQNKAVEAEKKWRKMPVYKYFGHPAKYHGKPLFHILSNLKNFGVGRIITRSSYETEDKNVAGPSFYRILWVQPLMDQESLLGSVVAEKVVEHSF